MPRQTSLEQISLANLNNSWRLFCCDTLQELHKTLSRCLPVRLEEVLPAGMGPAPSAPVPRVGYGRSPSFGPGAPMMLHAQDNRASAPLPAGGLQHGILPDGHLRGRKGRGRNGGNYNPHAMVSDGTSCLKENNGFLIKEAAAILKCSQSWKKAFLAEKPVGCSLHEACNLEALPG